jgi:alkanesulfonate monooxygenase SsuD/methylene tetrahydromethanopterin reductase-like flavin-dependent oxidoreductase (luciferase family)
VKFSIALHMERQSSDQSMVEASEQLLELLTLAEDAGFEIAWAVEHHAHEYYIGPNPLMQLVHWAGHTRRIRLGTAVVVVPYWHPIRLAGEAGMADLLTGGRLELGMARGAFQYEFDRMLEGLPQERGGEHLRETLDAVLQLWAGDYEHHGQHWNFPKATATPKPIQHPHPPIWIRVIGGFRWTRCEKGFGSSWGCSTTTARSSTDFLSRSTWRRAMHAATIDPRPCGPT